MCTEGEVASPTIQSPPIEATSKATPNLKQEKREVVFYMKTTSLTTF